MDDTAIGRAHPVHRAAPLGRAFRRRLELLRLLAPAWAIDVRAEGGEVVLEVFVYRRPVKVCAGLADLLEVRTVSFPTVERGRLCASPLDWVEVQILWHATPNVPAGRG